MCYFLFKLQMGLSSMFSLHAAVMILHKCQILIVIIGLGENYIGENASCFFTPIDITQTNRHLGMLGYKIKSFFPMDCIFTRTFGSDDKRNFFSFFNLFCHSSRQSGRVFSAVRGGGLCSQRAVIVLLC